MTPELPSTPSIRWSWPARAGLTVVALLELGLVGWALASRAALAFVVVQTLLVALLALGITTARFVGFRRAYEAAVAASAAEHERSRLAEDLHDVVGHDLSLIALQAGALQVTSTGDVAARAAALRMQVERVVWDLRETVDMLRSGRSSAATLTPTDDDVPALVERSRRAGASVALDGSLDDASVPAPVRLTLFGVVREGLTNAVKHSPGSGVVVRLSHDGDAARAEVEVDGGADEDPGTWSGLALVRDRVEALGGRLTVSSSHGRRLTTAQLPTRPRPEPPHPAAPGGLTRRRPTVATVRWAMPPLALVVTASTAFYAWSTHGATLEQPAFDAIRPGQRVDRLRSVLPTRQATIRLTRTPAVPTGWRCAYYTDGNFPLGMAAFEVCDDGARITRTTDLRKLPLP